MAFPAYEEDPKGFKSRMRSVLSMAKKHGVRIMFVFFDDCWNPHPKIGPQPSPKPGVHNSGWVQSPSVDQRKWPEDLPRLKHYVQDVLKAFKNEKAVYMWDLYNEPGNTGHGESSRTLFNAVFEWAREVRPSQPLTSGAWNAPGDGLDNACTDLSDVITFHCYGDADELRKQISY